MRFQQRDETFIDVLDDNYRFIGIIYAPWVKMEIRQGSVLYVSITSNDGGVSYCFDPRYDTWEVLE